MRIDEATLASLNREQLTPLLARLAIGQIERTQRRLGRLSPDPWEQYRGDPVRFITDGLEQCRGDDWRNWRTIFKAAYGQPLDDDELAFFRSVAEREPPTRRVRELWLIIGRRGGKDSVASLMALYAGLYADCSLLRPGERALVACFATDREQAGIVHGYIKGYFQTIPSLCTWLEGAMPDSYRTPVRLKHRVDVAVVTNNFKAPRGRPIAAAVFDECLVVGTEIETDEGPRPIESIKVGDLVWTRQGLSRVLRATQTRDRAPLWWAMFSNGQELMGTENHPVWIEGRGFVPLSRLEWGDEVCEKAPNGTTWPTKSYVTGVVKIGEGGPVYNLEVTGSPEYFANGVLVHNCAFWKSEDSATPDVETYNAVMPGMASVPGAMLIGISSPHMQRGLLYDNWKRYYKTNDPNVLVIRAPTRVMNPVVDRINPGVIDRAYEDDPERARAEYGAEWRRDLADFVPREIVESLVVRGRHELPPQRNVEFRAFFDASGGVIDSMALAVAHSAGNGYAILDCLREKRPPFDPGQTIAEFAEVLKAYNVQRVRSDRYAGQFPVAEWAKHGILCEFSEQSKSEIYLTLLGLLMSGRVELLDHRRSVDQLCRLERRSVRAGRDTVDHPPNEHDDMSNVLAGALGMCASDEMRSLWNIADLA